MASPGMGATWPAEYRRKVRYSDTDAQGVVFNGNYLVYVDDTITDLLEAAGLGPRHRADAGYDVVTARVEIDYRHPARFGDVVVTRARVDRIEAAAVVFAVECRVDDRLAARARVTCATVDHDERRPIRMPDAVPVALDTLHAGPIEEDSG